MDKKIEQLEKQIEEMKKTIRDLFLFFAATSIVFIGASLIDTKNYAVFQDPESSVDHSAVTPDNNRE